MVSELAPAVFLLPEDEERPVLVAVGSSDWTGDQGTGAGETTTQLSTPAGVLCRTAGHQSLTTSLTSYKATTVLSVAESVCRVGGGLGAGGYRGTKRLPEDDVLLRELEQDHGQQN